MKMRFWDRARKREPETAADVWKQLGQAAAQAHLAGEDPRQSEAVGMWIGLLWRCRRPEEVSGRFLWNRRREMPRITSDLPEFCGSRRPSCRASRKDAMP